MLSGALEELEWDGKKFKIERWERAEVVYFLLYFPPVKIQGKLNCQ